MVDFQMSGRIVGDADRTGESDYAEHARGQRLSRLERAIVVFALLLLTAAGFISSNASYSQSGGHPAYREITGSIGSSTGERPSGALQYCREGSPYPERAC